MWAILFGAGAFAQEAPTVPAMSVETWHLPIGSTATLWTEDTSLPEDGIVRFATGYQNAPLAYTWSNGDRIVVLRDSVRSDLVAGWSYGRARVGIDVPVYWYVAGDTVEAGNGLGDVGLHLAGIALDREVAPIGLGFTARVLLPTATVDAPVASGGVAVESALVVDRAFGPVLLAANLGTQVSPEVGLENVTLNDAFIARVGAGWTHEDALGASLDVGSRFNYASPLSESSGVPIEAIVGGWSRLGDSDWVVRGGVGRGLTPGIGAPVGRVLFAIGWEPPRERDTDADGLLDPVDACPLDPEDPDGFADDDGCPDHDNDSDGLVDVVDGCPMDAEDHDAWQDEDGCPDPLTQVTLRVVGPDDAPVPHATIQLGEQTVTGPELTAELLPGTFDLDVTADGFAPHGGSIAVPPGPPVEIVRKLRLPDPTTGTLSLTVTDPSGRPLPSWWAIGEAEPEALRDGTVHATLEPGIYQLTVSADSYVPVTFPAQVELGRDAQLSVMLQPVRVQVTREKLEITEKVFFDTDKATILPQSFPLLDEITTILLDRPDIVRVRIEGHTDSRGGDAYNQRLSEARAQSVRDYLVQHGVEAERLVSEGFGEARPLDANEVPAAWDLNRRVEFFIEAWAE